MLEIGDAMFRVIVSLCVVALLSGCSASDKLEGLMEASMHGVADKLPEWAGGPKKDLPPRPTDPRYAAYKDQIEGKNASVPIAEQASLSPLH